MPASVRKVLPEQRFELVEETPVAFVYDGATLAVMMATPADLMDFACGFTLTEGVSTRPPPVELRHHANGIECRMQLDAADALALRHRARARTTVAGTSCGLCGVRSLAEAVRAPASVAAHELRLRACELRGAVASLREHQPLHDRTRAAHAAALFVPGRGLVLVREDVGRHNALDKLVGAIVRSGERADAGAIVLTSRVSIEMVQKAAAIGAPVVVAVSAPTARAVRMARAAGITLVGNARDARTDPARHAPLDPARHAPLDIFTHPHRCVDDASDAETST